MTTVTPSASDAPARRYMGVSEAATYLGVSRSKMSRLLAELMRAGLIRQRRDLIDSRRARIPIDLLEKIKTSDLEIADSESIPAREPRTTAERDRQLGDLLSQRLASA